MSSESRKRNRSKVSPVNEGDIDKRPCIDTLHKSFSSTAYNETTIPEQDGFIVLSWIVPVLTTSRLHSTVLDRTGSDDKSAS